MLIITNKYIL